MSHPLKVTVRPKVQGGFEPWHIKSTAIVIIARNTGLINACPQSLVTGKNIQAPVLACLGSNCSPTKYHGEQQCRLCAC